MDQGRLAIANEFAAIRSKLCLSRCAAKWFASLRDRFLELLLVKAANRFTSHVNTNS